MTGELGGDREVWKDARERVWRRLTDREGGSTLNGEVGKRETAGSAVHEGWTTTHSSPGKSAEPPNISPRRHPTDQMSAAIDTRGVR
jgi:hypothetical protein